MKRSDKYIITAIVSFLLAALIIGLLAYINTDYFFLFFMPSLLLLIAGYSYGAARGWSDIEIRRSNPEWFEDEKLEDE